MTGAPVPVTRAPEANQDTTADAITASGGNTASDMDGAGRLSGYGDGGMRKPGEQLVFFFRLVQSL